jgi:DNA-binding protein YbaB
MHMETKKIMASIVEKTKHNGIVNVKIDGKMKVQFIHSENLHHTRI